MIKTGIQEVDEFTHGLDNNKIMIVSNYDNTSIYSYLNNIVKSNFIYKNNIAVFSKELSNNSKMHYIRYIDLNKHELNPYVKNLKPYDVPSKKTRHGYDYSIYEIANYIINSDTKYDFIMIEQLDSLKEFNDELSNALKSLKLLNQFIKVPIIAGTNSIEFDMYTRKHMDVVEVSKRIDLFLEYVDYIVELHQHEKDIVETKLIDKNKNKIIYDYQITKNRKYKIIPPEVMKLKENAMLMGLKLSEAIEYGFYWYEKQNSKNRTTND